MKTFYLYAVKDTETGKLVDHLTNPSHKFWWRKADAAAAIARGGGRARSCGDPVPRARLKLITLKVEEVPDEN